MTHVQFLKNKKILLNDEEIFEGSHCPKCGRQDFAPIISWIGPLQTAAIHVGRARMKNLEMTDHAMYLEHLR